MPRGGRRPYDVPGRYPPLLIAERYEPVRTPCAAYLNLLSFEVAEAAHAAEATAIIAAGWWPAVIITDGESAEAVSGCLKTSNHAVAPQLIVMTGALEPRAQSSATLLLKPFRLTTMAQTVRRALRRAARERVAPDRLIHASDD
jgi:DNA-binding NtrC family response regulator